jgi:hypothetical protein
VTVSHSKKGNARHAETARKLYLNDINPAEDAVDWHAALKEARKLIALALRASKNFYDIEGAMVANGGHMLVLRHLIAPPVSQDQFKLRCPAWPKSSEKNENPITIADASLVVASFDLWRDRRLTRWLDRKRNPTHSELRDILLAVSPLIAAQRIATLRRNRHASKQEQSVIDLLVRRGWIRLPSLLIDRRAAVPRKHFMHKTRFATASVAPQEVDIACGLKDTLVVAIECKVSNDETNSIKRINDVIKKAEAWRTHWGNFVMTAAILQGVIASKDVARLIDQNIHVFWSHDLPTFEKWINAQL